MFCSECGKSISEGNAFCDGCGAPMYKKIDKGKRWIFIPIAIVFLMIIIVFAVLSLRQEGDNTLGDEKILTGTYAHCHEDIKITFSEDGTLIWSICDIEFYDGTYNYVNGEYVITVQYKKVYDQQITYNLKAKKEGKFLCIQEESIDNEEIFIPIIDLQEKEK